MRKIFSWLFKNCSSSNKKDPHKLTGSFNAGLKDLKIVAGRHRKANTKDDNGNANKL